MTHLKILTAVSLACLMSNTAFADPMQNASDVSFVIGGGLTVGGDSLVDVELIYDDGDHSVEDLKAGELLYIYAGLNIALPNAPLDIQATIGYHFDSISADNGEVSFDRMPIDLLLLYHLGEAAQHRLGGGLTYHLSPELDLNDLGNGRYEADNALGFVFAYDYQIVAHNYLGVRYTNIEYDFDSISVTADGSNVGCFWTYEF